jgi:hypothetical protein
MDWKRIGTALMYGLVTALASYQASHPATLEGWLTGVITPFVVAAWGKYSSSTTVIAPDRASWTPEQRAGIVGAK